MPHAEPQSVADGQGYGTRQVVRHHEECIGRA
jgi:hypothetical protein